MRSGTTGKTPAPRVEKGMGAAGAGQGAPAAGLGQAPRAGGMSPEIKKKWSEFNEEERREYVIEIVDASVEDDVITIKRLELRRIYFPIYPYGNYTSTIWSVEWDGGDWVAVDAKCVHDNWGGTGCEPIGRLVVEVELPETPWFFNYYDLEGTIERHGVKKAMEWILGSIKDLAAAVVGDEE